MAWDKLRLTGKVLALFIPLAGKLLLQRIAAIYHQWAYKAMPKAEAVVVLGGSFAGIALAKRLAETLPTGFKVVLVEKNSHFNYTFNFPRFAVVQGYEHTAFIPYDGVAKGAPPGIFSHVKDTVVSISDTQAVLASGGKIDYRYLAIATGASQPLPVQLSSTERDEACLELRSMQQNIKDSQRVAIVGAGAVGIELATDIKDFYPDKDVTLIHSHGQVLNRFGKRLQDYVLPALHKLGVRVLLDERPSIPLEAGVKEAKTLKFSDGREETFDLVIACTGQRPNSSVLASLHPSAISKETSRILVKPTLQVSVADDPDLRIFAFGDVAEHGGPMMARAGFFQAEIVLANILAMINHRPPCKTYVPRVDFEAAIKLTLGKSHDVLYTMNDDGSDIMIVGHNGKVDLDIATAWKMHGADFKLASAVPETVEASVCVS